MYVPIVQPASSVLLSTVGARRGFLALFVFSPTARWGPGPGGLFDLYPMHTSGCYYFLSNKLEFTYNAYILSN